MVDPSVTGTFTATNATKNVNYSGSASALSGNSAGISKLSVTSTTDSHLTSLPQTAYGLEVPDTALLVATAPFYASGSGVLQSIQPPIFGTAQGSCPTSGANVNWIAMPPANWCSSSADNNPLTNCSTEGADNAYGTAAISVSGSTYAVSITSYELSGTKDSSSPVNLSGCTCSSGVIQCTDPSHSTHPVSISFTPSGVFLVDKADSAVAGIVQPGSNVDITDFLKSGRTFKAMFHTALDSSQISQLSTQSACTSAGGTWISAQSTCGTHATQPASATTDGTNFAGHPYSNIDQGTLSANGGSFNFGTNPPQPAPGLILGTFTDNDNHRTAPIVMAVRQINGKYVAVIVTYSPNATLGGGFNIFAVEQ
jgi:hypothetical protein